MFDRKLSQAIADFKELKQAGEKLDKYAIEALLNRSVPVDGNEHARYWHGTFLSPAGLFAAKGNHPSVKFMQAHGADPSMIALGYAHGCHDNHAESYRIEYNVNVDELAFAAASGNNYSYVSHLQNLGADFNDIIRGASYAGNWKWLETLVYEQMPLIEDVKFAIQSGTMQKILIGCRTIDEEQTFILKALVLLFDNEIKESIISHLREIDEKSNANRFNISEVIDEAERIKTIMKTSHLAFEDVINYGKEGEIDNRRCFTC
jgi:hypothetical protein